MTLDIEPIKARLAAATPLMWYFDVDGLPPNEQGGIRAGDSWLFREDEATGADTDLVANAPTDLAALVAEVERLRAAVERHRREAQAVNILVEPALADARLWAEVLE